MLTPADQNTANGAAREAINAVTESIEASAHRFSRDPVTSGFDRLPAQSHGLRSRRSLRGSRRHRCA